MLRTICWRPGAYAPRPPLAPPLTANTPATPYIGMTPYLGMMIRDGTGRKGRGGQRRGGEGGAGWGDGVKPPQSQIPGYVPENRP